MNTHATASTLASSGFAPLAPIRRSRAAEPTDPTRFSLSAERADQLVERLFFGDVVALEELQDRFAPGLRKVALAILGEGDERAAEKIVEKIFDDLCAGWPPPRGEVQRWLVRLVRREARRRRTRLGFDA